MSRKAIIFDIDATAIDSPEQKLPSERLVKAVANLPQDYILSAATGRVWSFAKPILRGMHLTAPCVISSGTQICDPQSGHIFWQSTIEPTDLRTAITILKSHPQLKVLFNDYEDEDYLYGGIPVVDLEIKELVYFLEVIFVPEVDVPQIVDQLSQIKGVAVTMVVAQRPGFKDIHITNRYATKEHAIAELLRLLKVERSDTIGVGDGHNDIHLFNAVAYKVAVANAVSELKEMADEVIGSVREDGFAAYLEGLSQAAP